MEKTNYNERSANLFIFQWSAFHVSPAPTSCYKNCRVANSNIVTHPATLIPSVFSSPSPTIQPAHFPPPHSKCLNFKCVNLVYGWVIQRPALFSQRNKNLSHWFALLIKKAATIWVDVSVKGGIFHMWPADMEITHTYTHTHTHTHADTHRRSYKHSHTHRHNQKYIHTRTLNYSGSPKCIRRRRRRWLSHEWESFFLSLGISFVGLFLFHFFFSFPFLSFFLSFSFLFLYFFYYISLFYFLFRYFSVFLWNSFFLYFFNVFFLYFSFFVFVCV